MQSLETALAAVSLFGHLRPDEIGRVARRFKCLRLDSTDIDAGVPQLCIVLSGLVESTIDDPLGEIHVRLRPGDCYGAAMVLIGGTRSVRMKPLVRSQVALLEREGLETILQDYPAVALNLVAELAIDLRKRNDQVRQILELRTAGIPPLQAERALAQARKSLALRSVGVRHVNASNLFRRWVEEKGAEPPFWMLIGFGLGLAGARLTVHFILRYHLEQHLFALVAGSDPNPVHIHHFNYGLVLVGTVGLVSLLPYGRRALRTLALLFGVGCALVFDEFALFWNLNPDYSQGLSLISAAIAAVVLIQLAYFRGFWTALFVRIAQWLGSE